MIRKCHILELLTTNCSICPDQWLSWLIVQIVINCLYTELFSIPTISHLYCVCFSWSSRHILPFIMFSPTCWCWPCTCITSSRAEGLKVSILFAFLLNFPNFHFKNQTLSFSLYLLHCLTCFLMPHLVSYTGINLCERYTRTQNIWYFLISFSDSVSWWTSSSYHCRWTMGHRSFGLRSGGVCSLAGDL